MPAGLAARMARAGRRRPYLLWPGASTPLGTLGYVSAGLELVTGFEQEGWAPPEVVVAALGSGGTAVGLAFGIGLGGWRSTRVVAVRAADRVVTSTAALGPLEAGTAALLALGGAVVGAPRLDIDGRWFGPGYGHPTPAGDAAASEARRLGLQVEPTYTAKALACALDAHAAGRRVVFLQTFAGDYAAASAPSEGPIRSTKFAR
jgi:D-cysteine desulfhydrase